MEVVSYPTAATNVEVGTPHHLSGQHLTSQAIESSRFLGRVVVPGSTSLRSLPVLYSLSLCM